MTDDVGLSISEEGIAILRQEERVEQVLGTKPNCTPNKRPGSHQCLIHSVRTVVCNVNNPCISRSYSWFLSAHCHKDTEISRCRLAWIDFVCLVLTR